jgi:hypothetical protein
MFGVIVPDIANPFFPELLKGIEAAASEMHSRVIVADTDEDEGQERLDPSPPVTLDQAVEEVRAAYQTLGDDLLAVEVGNEYDIVTTLNAGQYYNRLKRYRDAIAAAAPDAPVRMVGPSAKTSTTSN